MGNKRPNKILYIPIIPDAIEPQEIAKFAAYLYSDKADDISGKIFVLKKGKEPYEGYHT